MKTSLSGWKARLQVIGLAALCCVALGSGFGAMAQETAAPATETAVAAPAETAPAPATGQAAPATTQPAQPTAPSLDDLEASLPAASTPAPAPAPAQ